MEEHEARLHPICKEVAAAINKRIESGGYGFLIEHKELFEMLEIKEPTTIPEAMRQRLEVLKKVEELKNVLLYDYNVELHNEHNKGYRILEPDMQVTIGYDRQFQKAKKKIKKAIDILTHVNHGLLSQGGAEQRDRNINKSVFVLSAFNKRKLPDMGKNHKQIGMEATK